MKLILVFIAFLLVTSLNPKAFAQAKKTQSVRTQIYTPEQEMAGFKVPKGFVIELVASEKDGVINPIDLTFDDAGRLWTQTAMMYPLDPIADIQWNDLFVTRARTWRRPLRNYGLCRRGCSNRKRCNYGSRNKRHNL